MVQSGWEPKNEKRKRNHKVSNVCYFYFHWRDRGKIPWQMSLSQWVNNFSLDLSIVESLTSAVNSPRSKYDSEALGSKLQIFHDSIVSQFPEDN